MSAEKNMKELVEQLEQQQAAAQASKWATAPSRASRSRAEAKQLFVTDEARVMRGIPSLAAEHRDALAAALHGLTCPLDDAPERYASTPGSAHNVVQALLSAVQHVLGPVAQLRVFHEAELDSDNRPDFVCLERREALVTRLSSLLAVEVKPTLKNLKKRATELLVGMVQALRYTSCRVLALQVACPTTAPWEALAIVTNGEVVCAIRTVYTGHSFDVYRTADEPLLPRHAASVPELSRGAELLARLLAASPQQLGSAFRAAPSSAAVVSLPLDAPKLQQRPHRLTFGHTLGHGGFCDVFAGVLEGAGDVAIKLARSPDDADTAAQLRREARVLRKLSRAGSPHVPQLLAYLRLPDGAPGLVLAPVGCVATCAPGSEAPPGSPARRALAVACGDGVFAALRAAHAMHHLHADVRPTNVLWRPPPYGAVLADWGLSRASRGTQDSLHSRALGWLHCAPDAALRAEALPGMLWLPADGTDCESALYALAALAFGVPCGAAPWADAAPSGTAAALLAARSAWFSSLPAAHPLRAARTAVLAWQDDPFCREGLYALPHEWAAQ